jgi:hypothetical protein
VLRDYFLVRVSQNEALQKALLSKFSEFSVWAGYYIPDEIDDLTWRQPQKTALIKDYITLMCERLRKNDSSRSIAISAFFRSRTSPKIFSKMLQDVVAGGTPNLLMIQDGAGSGDPPTNYIPLYFKELAASWNIEKTHLVGIVELFQQTSPQGKPFAAEPAPPQKVQQQLKNAKIYFDQIFLFTFSDYANPDLSTKAKALFDILKTTKTQ